jgi:hypothetical protein
MPGRRAITSRIDDVACQQFVAATNQAPALTGSRGISDGVPSDCTVNNWYDLYQLWVSILCAQTKHKHVAAIERLFSGKLC